MTTAEKTIFEEISGTANEIIQKIKQLIQEGNARRVIIKNKNGKILFQSHLIAGIAGTALFVSLAPIISAITMFVLFVKNVTVLVERDIDPDADENEIKADVVEIDEEDEDAEPASDKK